ncbi:hypothetical protein AVEN_273746-1 [Araneus ventricosus]|uniref:Uncharacterized protein n=1 Tax=Araneus ventricosus TaxID=182803 RepID=A0A4Y2RAF7_ARAVE|nr:hypothetical protein AVEN_273746-1 [Araneus ventricosus]
MQLARFALPGGMSLAVCLLTFFIDETLAFGGAFEAGSDGRGLAPAAKSQSPKRIFQYPNQFSCDIHPPVLTVEYLARVHWCRSPGSGRRHRQKDSDSIDIDAEWVYGALGKLFTPHPFVIFVDFSQGRIKHVGAFT